MRRSNSGQTRIDQIVRGVGPLMAAVIVMLACADPAFADASATTGRLNGDAHLVAVVNDWDPLPEQWQLHSADRPWLTSMEREEVGEVEEIKVIANPKGRTAMEIENRRLESMREAMHTELRLRERGAEEMAWRQADPDLENPELQIKWGYSPQAEYRMRRDNDFTHALSADYVKPASVIRIAF